MHILKTVTLTVVVTSVSAESLFDYDWGYEAGVQARDMPSEDLMARDMTYDDDTEIFARDYDHENEIDVFRRELLDLNEYIDSILERRGGAIGKMAQVAKNPRVQKFGIDLGAAALQGGYNQAQRKAQEAKNRQYSSMRGGRFMKPGSGAAEGSLAEEHERVEREQRQQQQQH